MFEELKNKLTRYERFNEYVIQIGVVSANTKRKETFNIGLTNAEVLYINEHGSPVNKMPPRPVLHITIDWAQQTKLIEKTLQSCTQHLLKDNWTEKDIEDELNRMCIKMQNHARHIIYDNDGQLAPNAPSVIKRKGFNHPLFQTGQLANSITCRIVKKSSITE